jgi:uncharacterized protein (TIGR00725 family)
MYKQQISIIGSRELSQRSLDLVESLACELISSGYRTVTGGLGSLQKAVHKGAKASPHSSDCDTIVLLPGFDPEPAIGHADVIIPTGLDAYRNAMVANSEAVVAVGGGAGTLSEMAFAWQFNRPVFAVGDEGWAHRLAGMTLDHRREAEIIDCSNFPAIDVVKKISSEISAGYARHIGIS